MIVDSPSIFGMTIQAIPLCYITRKGRKSADFPDPCPHPSSLKYDNEDLEFAFGILLSDLGNCVAYPSEASGRCPKGAEGSDLVV